MLVEENVKLMLHNQINVNSITAATSLSHLLFSIGREKFTKWLFLDVWSFQERFSKVKESDIEGLNTLWFKKLNIEY